MTMSHAFVSKIIAFGFLGLLAACAADEEVVADPSSDEISEDGLALTARRLSVGDTFGCGTAQTGILEYTVEAGATSSLSASPCFDTLGMLYAPEVSNISLKRASVYVRETWYDGTGASHLGKGYNIATSLTRCTDLPSPVSKKACSAYGTACKHVRRMYSFSAGFSNNSSCVMSRVSFTPVPERIDPKLVIAADKACGCPK